MKPDYAMISSYNCPHCSRSQGAGHHDDCPRHARAVEKLVERERDAAAEVYATEAARGRRAGRAALRRAFAAGAQWAASKATARTDE